MMKTLFLSVGLAVAMLAAASPPTSQGGKTTTEMVVRDNKTKNTGSVPTSTNPIVMTAMGEKDATINPCYCSEVYGQETVHDPWTHSVTGNCINFHTVNNFRIVQVIEGGIPTGQVDRRRLCASTVSYYNLKHHRKFGPAAMMAPAPRIAGSSLSMRHNMAHVTSYLSGYDLRG